MVNRSARSRSGSVEKRGTSSASTKALESEERYQAFIQTSHEGIWRFEVDEPISTKLSPDEQIALMYERAYLAEANNAMAAMYGLESPSALIGMRLPDMLVREDPHNTAYLKAFIASGYALSGVESREVDARGQEKIFLNSLVGVARNGYLLRAWGTQQDVTAQFKAEAALRESEATNVLLKNEHDQLLALNKSKDEFISLASHQLRTPATIVKQYIGMLLEGFSGPVPAQHKAFLQVAYESNERQLQIINDLLRVARVDAGKLVLEKKRANLGALVADVVSEQASLFEVREQELVVKQPSRGPYAAVDAPRFRMVLENLIDNASKYSKPGKTTTITIESHKDQVCISITDQGVGIAKKDISKLFQKFSRIDNSLSARAGGSGLGLYWAKKIIDLHEGRIEVESRLRHGTTFRIYLS